jgi:hypothetical protein
MTISRRITCVVCYNLGNYMMNRSSRRRESNSSGLFGSKSCIGCPSSACRDIYDSSVRPVKRSPGLPALRRTGTSTASLPARSLIPVRVCRRGSAITRTFSLLLLANRPDQQEHQPGKNEQSTSAFVHGLTFLGANKSPVFEMKCKGTERGIATAPKWGHRWSEKTWS